MINLFFFYVITLDANYFSLFARNYIFFFFVLVIKDSEQYEVILKGRLRREKCQIIFFYPCLRQRELNSAEANRFRMRVCEVGTRRIINLKEKGTCGNLSSIFHSFTVPDNY